MRRHPLLFAPFFAASLLVFQAHAQVDSTGVKLIEQRKLVEAQSFFEERLKADKKDVESQYQLARVLLFQQKMDEAEDAIDEALDLNDRDARFHFLRGQILGEIASTANVFKQGFLAPKVKNAFLRAVELDSTFVDARVGLYNYYIMAPGIMGGSEEKALKQANEVVKLNSYRGHILLANFHQRKKEFAEAEDEYKKAIDAEPKRTGGYKSLGYFFIGQKKFDEAIIQFKKYIELDPKNPDALDSFGDALFNQEKYDEAIEKYNAALSLDKNFPPSIYQLGACYEKKGMNAKAVETYQWYLSVAPAGRNADSAKKKIKELS
jgi:tetratricopeptide (TPR) repeat protein